MRKIKKLSFSPSDIVNVNEQDYEIITATAEMLGGNGHLIGLSSLVYYLKNVDTGEMEYLCKKEMISALPKCRECGEKIKIGVFCDDGCRKSYMDYLNS